VPVPGDAITIDGTGRFLLPGLTDAHVLVIEVGSPGTRRRDETIKRRLYERSQVREYWMVDPELEVVRIYRREGDGFARPQELSREAGDVVTSALFPNFELRSTRFSSVAAAPLAPIAPTAKPACTDREASLDRPRSLLGPTAK
jgi:hypothetical protein